MEGLRVGQGKAFILLGVPFGVKRTACGARDGWLSGTLGTGFPGLKGGAGGVCLSHRLLHWPWWGAQGLTVGAAPWEVVGSGPSSWAPLTQRPHSLVGMLFSAFGQSETDLPRRPAFGCPADGAHLRSKASQKQILCPVRLSGVRMRGAFGSKTPSW